MAEKLEGLGYGHKGNLHIICYHCGSSKTFHAKNEMEVFTCRNCGRKTGLDKMTVSFANCECGNSAVYKTNAVRSFDLECFNCGQPVAMFKLHRRGKKDVFMSAYSIELQEEKRKR